jgi:hypothetical protein
MPLRQDIIRGARVGTILLALLIVGYAGYRVTHEPAGTVPAETPKAQTAPVKVPDMRYSNGPALPPPPPAKSRKPVRPPVAQTVVAQTVDAAPAAEKEPAATHDEKAVEENSPSDVKESEPVEASAEPASPPEDPAQPEARGRRWLKAVGRFLHLAPKKDLNSDRAFPASKP